MQKVRVTDIKVETGDKDGRPWERVTIIGDDGTGFTTFDTKAKGLKGALIELEPIVKGNYVNFKKWKVLEEPTATAPVAKTDPAAAMLQIQADFKIAAVQVAGRLAAAGKINKEDIEGTTNKIYAWLTSQAQTTTAKAEVEGKTTEETWEGMASGERDPDTIKTLGDLFTACLTDFKMQRPDVIKQLGYSKQEDIGESPAECYRIIALNPPPKNPP